MMDPIQFAEKYRLAQEAALAEKPENGVCGFELEWNLLDENFRPLLTVGSGPGRQSFVDYLRSECLSPWLRDYSQLEVFHWMIEWATRPYYTPRGAVYEGRLMEAALLNALHKAGEQFGGRLYAWPGNLPFLTQVGPDSIPGSWHLAKRRYLERCVRLYGDGLATAGTHTNLSLPEPLLAWDFMHLPAAERGDRHLDDYKSEFYITAARLLRGFAALFVAASAATPLQAQERDGEAVVVLTEADSIRNLTFPNPSELDRPGLYRSYADYLQQSYDLVRRGVRFGNNNWTPTRARSFAEPVERLIAVTSEQLQALYARGLYAVGQEGTPNEMAQQIEMQNLLARINLPMARVEVRTDDEGHPLEVDIANLTLKHLLLLRFYADPDFARSFRYDQEDLTRARRNEMAAARQGLRAEIENPLTGKPVGMREFLDWTLDQVRPLAEALELWEDLEPLQEMAAGGPNTAERMRSWLRAQMSGDEVPSDLLRALAEARQSEVQRDVERIAGEAASSAVENAKLGEFLQRAREHVHFEPQAPVRFRPRPETMVEAGFPDKTAEVLAVAQALVRIPSVTVGAEERLEEVRRAGIFIYDYLRNHGLDVRYFNRSKYPAVLAGFPGGLHAPVMLSGHFDVVAPEPDEGQFEPRLEGDYLWGRGSADMKTVVATYVVWLKDALRHGPPYPAVNLLLVGNEENGESEPMGTPHVLRQLAAEADGPEGETYAPALLIAGERTGESGADLWGEVCTENRGVMRFELTVRGARGHSGTSAGGQDLSERLLEVKTELARLLAGRLTLESSNGWRSQARFPYIQVGQPGIYNITPEHGLLGVEVRPIPQDDLGDLYTELSSFCEDREVELSIPVMENGVACDPANPYLQALLAAVREASGQEPRIGRKLPGTSARFAPGGQGVVWGQSGLGPHAADERHYVPSIEPYYRALEALGRIMVSSKR